MLYGLEHPQWLRSFFNGSPYLKRPASQNSAFYKLKPSRLIGNTLNQLEEVVGLLVLEQGKENIL